MDRAPGDESEPLIEGMDELPRGSFALPEPPARLREAVLQRTNAAIRARRRKRRLVVVLGLALVYVAGVATSRFAGERPVGEPRAVSGPPTLAAQAADAGDLLKRVLDAPPAERARLLREAGDAFLVARGDVEAALHCYRQVLELTEPAARSRPEASDTWLLAALKDGHRVNSRR